MDIVVATIYMTLVAWGTGRMFLRIIGWNLNFFVDVAAGIGFLGTLSYLLNFFTPLTESVRTSIVGTGFACALIAFIECKNRLRNELKNIDKWQWLLILGSLVVFVIHARVDKMLYDTGFYHLQMIKMFQNQVVTNGMFWLHHNYGFNSAWFGALALFWAPGFNFESAFVGNVILVWCFVGFLILNLKSNKPIYSLITLILLCLPSFLGSGRHILFEGLGTTNTDTPSAVMGLMSILFVMRSFSELGNSKKQSLWVAAYFGLFATTFKLSAVILVLGSLSLICYHGFWKNSIKPFVVLIGLGAIWAARGLWTTGCVGYPSGLTCLPVSWRVPNSISDSAMLWITAWARDPGKDLREVIGNWSWFETWVVRFVRSGFHKNILYLVIVGAVLIVISKGRNWTKEKLLYLVFLIAGVLLWFFQAPDMRFGYAVWIGLSIMLFANEIGEKSFIHRILEEKPQRYLMLILLASLSLSDANLKRLKNWQEIAAPPIPAVEVVELQTHNGVIVRVPKSGDQCWNTPPFCGGSFGVISDLDKLMYDNSEFYPRLYRLKE